MADPGRPPAPPRRRWSGWRYERWALVELFALCGFVVVQPLLEILGDSPDFFIFHRVGGGAALALVAVLVLVPPLILWGLGAGVGLAGQRARRVAHVATLTGLSALFVIQLGKHLTSVRGPALAVLALALAGVIMFGYLRLQATRQLLRFAGRARWSSPCCSPSPRRRRRWCSPGAAGGRWRRYAPSGRTRPWW